MQCLTSNSMRRWSLRTYYTSASDILTRASATVRCFFWFARWRHRRLAWQRLTSPRTYLQPIISVGQDMTIFTVLSSSTMKFIGVYLSFFSEYKPAFLSAAAITVSRTSTAALRRDRLILVIFNSSYPSGNLYPTIICIDLLGDYHVGLISYRLRLSENAPMFSTRLHYNGRRLNLHWSDATHLGLRSFFVWVRPQTVYSGCQRRRWN